MDEHLAFLKQLHSLAPRLWFSTPDKVAVPQEGVRTYQEWVALLKEAGYGEVKVDMSQWTYLFECIRADV